MFSAFVENVFYGEKSIDKHLFFIIFIISTFVENIIYSEKIMETIEQEAEKALRTCLEKVPFLKIEEVRLEKAEKGLFPDVIVKTSMPEGEQIILLEVKNNGQPRMARDAVNQLLRYKEAFPNAYCVFCAPYISSASAEICRQDGAGFIDFAGNCCLSFGRVYIEQSGRQNPAPVRRELRTLYSPKATRALRVLLSNPGTTWKTQMLAAEADVSLGLISNIKKLLEDREIIRTGRKGIILRSPENLLSEWTENYSYKKNQVRYFYSLKSIPEIEADIAGICRQKDIGYALTGFSGAARFAPSVRYQRAMAYLSSNIDEVSTQSNLKEVTSGPNIMLFTPYDEGVFYGRQQVDDINIVSPIQLYLDLQGFPGRGEEAAEVLLERIIRPAW